MTRRSRMGTVYLIGAGPGAPDLLTLRAADLLRRAGIVFYDALVHPATLALAPGAEQVAVGKRCGRHSTAQRFINKRLIDAAAKHEVVVRLKGGDPMLFARAQEEIDALAGAGIPVVVVPGVTAALAASAEIGVSLSRRGVSRSVVFATPRAGAGEDATDWARAVAAADTAVLYMAAGQAREVAAALQAAGMAPGTPVAVVSDASLPAVRTSYSSLAQLGAAAEQWNLSGPAVILVGEVYRDAGLAHADATQPDSAACVADGAAERA